MPKPAVICAYCRKRVHLQRNGAWYHNRNASAFCHPGNGSGRKALPYTLPASDAAMLERMRDDA